MIALPADVRAEIVGALARALAATWQREHGGHDGQEANEPNTFGPNERGRARRSMTALRESVAGAQRQHPIMPRD